MSKADRAPRIYGNYLVPPAYRRFPWTVPHGAKKEEPLPPEQIGDWP